MTLVVAATLVVHITATADVMAVGVPAAPRQRLPGRYTQNAIRGEFNGVTKPHGLLSQAQAAELQAPVITSPASASGTVGSPFTYTITASNSPSVYWATGLPSGATADSVSGVVTYLPASVGTSSIVVWAENVSGRGSQPVQLIASAPLGVPWIIRYTDLSTGSGLTNFHFQTFRFINPWTSTP